MVWGGRPDDPEATTLHRESVRLAFVAALQHLTPPQRAAVLLFDVLALQASEVAELLDTSVAAVNSSLQRARAHLAKLDPEVEQDAPPLDDARKRALLAEYVDAFERYDVPRIVRLLSADAVWEMPPFTGLVLRAGADRRPHRDELPGRAGGRPDHGRGVGERRPGLRALHARPRRRGAPRLPPAGPHARRGRVTHVAAFFDTDLFARFGLPDELPPEHRERARVLRQDSGPAPRPE